jgi:hypothetical protein
LAEDASQAESDLNDRLEGADVKLLHAWNANIDRRADSGFLLCYSDRPFSGRSQDFTSDHVEEEIWKKVRTIPIKEKAQLVLDHLNHQKVDRSGASLEGVTAELLSRGSEVKWVQSPLLSASASVEVNWKPHSTRIRSIERGPNDIYSQLGATDKILCPTNVSFPVTDLVLSCNNADGDVLTYQSTWQETHPFTLGALYKLRKVHLRIDDNRKLVINFVVHGKEDLYAKRDKLSYVVGNPKLI